MKSRSNGLTLLEILVILAIVGVLLGALGFLSVQGIRRANLHEAATAVYVELGRARAQAQRQSVNQPVSWTATALSIGGRTINLPNGARIVTPAATGYTYTAPYGELSPAGFRLELVDASNSYRTAVDAVGVTGKATRRQLVAFSAPIP